MCVTHVTTKRNMVELLVIFVLIPQVWVGYIQVTGKTSLPKSPKVDLAQVRISLTNGEHEPP